MIGLDDTSIEIQERAWCVEQLLGLEFTWAGLVLITILVVLHQVGENLRHLTSSNIRTPQPQMPVQSNSKFWRLLNAQALCDGSLEECRAKEKARGDVQLLGGVGAAFLAHQRRE